MSNHKKKILVFKWSHLVENLCQSGILLKIDLKEIEKKFSLSIVSEDQHSILKPNTYEFLPNHHYHGQKKNQDRCSLSWKLAGYKSGKLRWQPNGVLQGRYGNFLQVQSVKHCVIFIVIMKYELIELNDSKYKLLDTT